jgi:hypothetical protein
MWIIGKMADIIRKKNKFRRKLTKILKLVFIIGLLIMLINIYTKLGVIKKFLKLISRKKARSIFPKY